MRRGPVPTGSAGEAWAYQMPVAAAILRRTECTSRCRDLSRKWLEILENLLRATKTPMDSSSATARLAHSRSERAGGHRR